MTGEVTVVAVVGAVVGLGLWWIWQKGKPFARGDVFRASRWSRGNRLFPTQVQVSPTTVVQHTPRWVGRQEESIHIAHVASVKIATGLWLSTILIETSGGASPIHCHGHWTRDAARMKALIEQHQSAYYVHARPQGTVDQAASGR